MRTSKYYWAVTSGLLLGLASLASAQVIIYDTFDGLTPGANLAAWSGGNIANNSVTAASGLGVGGSIGVKWALDFNQQYNGYQAYQWQNGSMTGNTSPNAGDYTLSFDLNVNGPVPLTALQVNVQSANSWSGPWGATGAAGVPVSPTLGWQHVSVALNNPIWTANALNPAGTIYQVQFQLNGWQLQGGGPAMGEVVVLDNLSLVMVPEPGALALAALGVAALLFGRK